MRRYNYIFDGTLKAGHDFTYKYDPKDPFRLLSVDAKEYRSSTEEVDTTRREHSYAFDGNGNLVLQLSDLAERTDSASFADTAAMQVRQYLWDEDNHLLAINDNGFVSNYFYDAAGERTVKISAPDLAVFVNGAEALKNDSALVKFVGYVSPYLVVSNGGRYTKHIYAGTQRIASKVGDIEAFGEDPRREEYAGANLKEVDLGSKYEQQTKALFARYDSLGVMNKPRELNDYVGGQSFCCGEKELVSNNQTGDNTFETPDYEHLIFFYHPDHLGSTALVTDNDGNVVQSVAYIPYGEVFIEERNGTWNTPYLFNGKELDEETGLYYYGARYLNPTNGIWLSVDPLWEKYVGMSPYNYCVGNPVKLVDPDGRRISAENEESQSYMKQDFANAFGKERLQYIDFGKDGNVSINNEKAFMKGMSKEQKRLYNNGLKPLINDKEINYKVLYAEKSILEGKERDINSDFGGGAYSSSDKKIVISPSIGKQILDGAPIYTEVYSDVGMFSLIDYKVDFSQIKNRYEIEQNTTSGLFHEIGEAIWDRSSKKHLRGNIIDFENNVRTVMGMKSRPYDSTHFNDKDPNFKKK